MTAILSDDRETIVSRNPLKGEYGMRMSNREKCIALLDEMSEEQLANIAVILQATKKAMDQAASDAFCESLYQEDISR